MNSSARSVLMINCRFFFLTSEAFWTWLLWKQRTWLLFIWFCINHYHWLQWNCSGFTSGKIFKRNKNCSLIYLNSNGNVWLWSVLPTLPCSPFLCSQHCWVLIAKFSVMYVTGMCSLEQEPAVWVCTLASAISMAIMQISKLLYCKCISQIIVDLNCHTTKF